MKFYISALVGVIIKMILQNARCNNKGLYEKLKQCSGKFRGFVKWKYGFLKEADLSCS